MNILLITEFFPEKRVSFSGGVEARAYYVWKYLSKKHQVKVISRGKTNVPATPLSILDRFWFQVKAVIDGLRLSSDVVEGSNFVSYFPAFVVAKMKRAKTVAWYADVYGKTWFETMSWPVAVSGWLMEWLSLKLPWHRVIAMSHSTKGKLVKAGIQKDKIEVVYGGVDLVGIRNIKVKRYKKPTICTAARLVNYKQIDDLIRAISFVREKIPNVRLVIMGDGPQEDVLKTLVAQLGLSRSVVFTGNIYHEKVLRIMKKCWVFSLPSMVEGFGLVTVEAMACGLPYVNADIPATREITLGGKGGMLYKPRKIDELANNIIRLIQDKRLYQLKRLVGEKLVIEYDWRKISIETAKVYEAIL